MREKKRIRANYVADAEAACQYQILNLKDSALLYDRGGLHQFINIATIIRSLCHDGSSKSILNANREGGRFFPSCVDIELQSLSTAACRHISMAHAKSGASIIIPNIHLKKEEMNLKKFKYWWREIIMTDHLKNGLSRGGMVLAVSNSEGGAHFTENIDEVYDELARMNGLRMFHHSGLKWNEFGIKPVQDTLRQIAHEFLVGMADWISTRQSDWKYDPIIPEIRDHAIAPGIKLNFLSIE